MKFFGDSLELFCSSLFSEGNGGLPVLWGDGSSTLPDRNLEVLCPWSRKASTSVVTIAPSCACLPTRQAQPDGLIVL